VLGEGEDHLSWSIGVGTVLGTRFRFHVVLPIWIAAELLRTVDARAPGLIATGCLMAGFVVILVARELARAAFARAMGAQFESVVIWPLGGITAATPLGRVRAGFQPGLAESGGVLFGMLGWPVLAAAVWMLGGNWMLLSMNLLEPGRHLDGVGIAGGSVEWELWAAWSLYYANAVILVVNVMIPMFPLDAARMLRGWQERRLGDEAAATLVCKLGFLAALIGVVGGGVTGQTRVMAVGVLGGIATWIELRRARFFRELLPEWSTTGTQVSPEGLLEFQEFEEDARLDEVLQKISRHGMESLSEEEKAFLQAMTHRRRLG
jgi:Zn-dependent protease